MQLKTSSEKENPYMKRKELVVAVDHSGAATPSNAAVQQMLAQEQGVEPEQVDIKGIYTLVGRQSSRAIIFVWQEKKVANLAKPPEPEAPKEAASPESTKPAEGAPAEAPKEGAETSKAEEAPKEEPKAE